jgi:DNA-binding NtrC family response regulator
MNIAIVDDDNWYREFMKHTLALNSSYSIHEFSTGQNFLKEKKISFDLVFLDFNLPDTNAIELIKTFKDKKSTQELEIVIISGQKKVKTAVELLSMGIHDYIVKDAEARNRILNLTNRLSKQVQLQKELLEIKNKLALSKKHSQTLIGDSNIMKNLKELIVKTGKSNISVSIKGETGTGKEVVANMIHEESSRPGNFVAVNVSAIPSDLIESEMFGHVKGAFTGATSDRIGKFVEANNGTLFLDEIAEMSLEMQVKLLRAIQENEITPLGSNKKVKFNVRIITATHKDLNVGIENGSFRSDLFYRLLGFPIHIPPLKERSEDIASLAHYFMELFAKDNGLITPTLSKEALLKLEQYDYPGNVRELKSIIELALTIGDGIQILADDIQFNRTKEVINVALKQERTLKDYNLMIIKHYLKKNNSNVLKTAKILDIGKSSIYRFIKENNINL